MGLTVSGIPVISDALRALAALKNGVSKETHSTSIPCWRSTSPDIMLSSPPEHRPKARTFFFEAFTGCIPFFIVDCFFQISI